MKKVIILLIVIAILAIAFFAGYRYIYKKETGGLKFSGELEMLQVDAAFRVSGAISSTYFSEGESVKKGDILAVLDEDIYNTQLKLAQANESAAKWALEDLKATLKKSGAAKKELLEQTQSQLDAAAANRELAELQLSYTKLVSPVSGVVLAAFREAGEMVQAGAPVFSIGSPDKLWMRAYLPENRASDVKLGQKMLVSVTSIPNQKFNGVISFISDKAEFTPKQIRTSEERVKLVYRIKIDIEDTKGVLKPGIPADAVIAGE